MQCLHRMIFPIPQVTLHVDQLPHWSQIFGSLLFFSEMILHQLFHPYNVNKNKFLVTEKSKSIEIFIIYYIGIIKQIIMV